MRRRVEVSSKKPKDKESQTSLKEELNKLSTKVAQLQRLLEENDSELTSKRGQVSKLEQVIAAKDGDIAALKQTKAEADEKLKDFGDSLSQAVAGYKALVIEANPRIPAELIGGDTIATIQDSLKRASALVDKVKQGLEAEVMSARVPPGAPVRTPPDLSGLSASEKIRYAIGGN